MRWPRTAQELITLFAESALSMPDVAEVFASSLFLLRSIELQSEDALSHLFDALETGDADPSRPTAPDPARITALAKDLEQLFADFGVPLRDRRSDSAERPVPYLLGSLRSSRRAKLDRESPTAAQISRSSMMSSRRSPDSYLLT